jgi:VWFA-related protein
MLKRHGTVRRARLSARVLLLAVACAWLAAARDGRSQAPQQEPAAPATPAGQAPPAGDLPPIQLPEQPTFRGGISFVRVDVIVTDNKAAPVTDLKQEDFEVLEDDQLQSIEQFRLIKVDGNPKPGEPPPRQLRNRDDEEGEAARDDVRVYAILLDDYHVRRANSISVRAPLTRFIQTQLRPNDMIAVMYPLQPASDVSFTRNHASIISAIERFEGRKYDYRPRNQMEENYVRYPTETVERIRNDVVMGALRGLSVRLGSLSERRKSIIFVSEGFTAMLPPGMRRADASMPIDPRTIGIPSGAGDTPREQTAAFFSQADVFSRLRDVFEAANRNNTAIYSLDPRGLAVFEFDLDDTLGPVPSFATDQRVLQMTTDTLRTLSEETDGRAIVNRNTLLEGLNQIVRDSSYYYLLGYNSKAPTDGKFHQIKVRVKRRGMDVRARRGFWAATPADVERIAKPAKEIAKPVQMALASIAPAVQASRYVRTWVGSQRGTGGKTKVTVVWEPMPAPPGARREAIASLSVLAADGGGNLVYRGRSGGGGAVNVGSGPGSVRPATPPATGAAASSLPPQQVTFDAPPGKLELRLTVEGVDGAGTLDRETQTIDVPDFSAAQPLLSTPRVYRGRTARDLQLAQADAAAVPAIARDFSRTERLLIRFDAYMPGTEQAAPVARLLNRAGDKISDLTVVPATAGGTHQVDVGLNTTPPGEYLVELSLPGATGEVSSLVAFRVGS